MSASSSDEHVILLGASTRAAAMSALRAGWTPWCADLFADADLERVAVVRRVPGERYPRGLLEALRGAPPGPVFYTGALENYPALIARIERPLWGNSPEVLRAVRDPRRWTQALRDAGLPCPQIAPRDAGGGRWLVKPRRSGGGLGIRPFAISVSLPRGCFLQEQIDGAAVSALFLGNNGDATLIGVTRQLVGVDWLHAPPFGYAGNLGPLPLDARTTSHWQRIGATLAQRFGLRGLFGVDAIERDGVPWPVEINPRYTASVELFERALGTPLLPLHRDAFDDNLENLVPELRLGMQASKLRFESSKQTMPTPRGETEFRGVGSQTEFGNQDLDQGLIQGKAILYAYERFTFPHEGPWLASLERDAALDAIEYADVPHGGETMEAGTPVLTVFARGATVHECEAMLQEKARALDRLWRG